MEQGNTFLAQMMASNSLSQVQIAQATGISQQTISKLCSGVTKTPSRDTALRLAEYFEVSTDEIYQQ